MKKDRKKLKKKLLQGGIEAGVDGILVASKLSSSGGIPALVGAALSTTAKQVLKSQLTDRETERVAEVYEIAVSKIKNRLEEGSTPRKDLNKKRYIELTEGTLLKAKDTYEEKKIPLIANLLATAPFTNTPIENLNQTLIYAEQLSYRQLAEISVVGQNQWKQKLDLTEKSLGDQEKKIQLNEDVKGIYSDISYLLAQGFVGQELSPGAGPAIASGMYMFAPNMLKLLYPGTLLFNGLQLDNIDKKVLDHVISTLRME